MNVACWAVGGSDRQARSEDQWVHSGRDFLGVTDEVQILSIATPWLFFHISTTALAIMATTIR